MKLHNPFKVAANDGNGEMNVGLVVFLAMTIVLCGTFFIIVTLHFFGPWFLMAILGIVGSGRILYAVFKGK
jgi:hypothetical protein